MARKKSNAGLWWIVGIIVLIAMVPREVWIGLGVLGAIAIAAYVVIKWQAGSKAASKAGPTDQRTLAELMSSQTPSRSRIQQQPARPTINPAGSAPPAQRAAQPLSKPALPVDRAITPPPAPKPLAPRIHHGRTASFRTVLAHHAPLPASRLPRPRPCYRSIQPSLLRPLPSPLPPRIHHGRTASFRTVRARPQLSQISPKSSAPQTPSSIRRGWAPKPHLSEPSLSPGLRPIREKPTGCSQVRRSASRA